MSTLAQDLAVLRSLKDEAEFIGRQKKDADATFKQHQAHCHHRMEAEESKSFRHAKLEYLFTSVDKVKGQVEDRRPYIRHQLENDPAIVEFLGYWTLDMPEADVERFEQAFFEAITSTSTVEYKEKTDIMNAQAKAHVDDNAPMPPGLTFRPDIQIQMRKD